MHKPEIVRKIAESANITQLEARVALKSVLSVISQVLAKNDRVTLAGFGSFWVTTRAARNGRNPITGEKIKIPQKRTVKFSVSKALKESINGKG